MFALAHIHLCHNRINYGTSTISQKSRVFLTYTRSRDVGLTVRTWYTWSLMDVTGYFWVAAAAASWAAAAAVRDERSYECCRRHLQQSLASVVFPDIVTAPLLVVFLLLNYRKSSTLTKQSRSRRHEVFTWLRLTARQLRSITRPVISATPRTSTIKSQLRLHIIKCILDSRVTNCSVLCRPFGYDVRF